MFISKASSARGLDEPCAAACTVCETRECTRRVLSRRHLTLNHAKTAQTCAAETERQSSRPLTSEAERHN